MSRECDVPTCSDEGRHETGEDYVLCTPHALEWDDTEEERLSRLSELHLESPDAADADVWNECTAEWLGARK